MIKLIRGRLRDGAWVDEESIFQADPKHYNTASDMAAGGRIAFDQAGHVFLSLGMKSNGYRGIQDLGAPDGKIHRLHDDGRIPEDNPFVDRAGALPSIWTYGHRSVHGLEFDLRTGVLWGTEMGPRGGDEVNLLRRGQNYGWPLTSHGVHYNGRRVDGAGLGIEFDTADLVEPVIDLTPSVAVSSFVFYEGDAFPGWRGQMLVGSLKGSDLYRFVFEDGALVQRETVIEDLARIRDIEVGPRGAVYLLLEHAAGVSSCAWIPLARPRTGAARVQLSASGPKFSQGYSCTRASPVASTSPPIAGLPPLQSVITPPAPSTIGISACTSYGLRSVSITKSACPRASIPYR